MGKWSSIYWNVVMYSMSAISVSKCFVIALITMVIVCTDLVLHQKSCSPKRHPVQCFTFQPELPILCLWCLTIFSSYLVENFWPEKKKNNNNKNTPSGPGITEATTSVAMVLTLVPLEKRFFLHNKKKYLI